MTTTTPPPFHRCCCLLQIFFLLTIICTSSNSFVSSFQINTLSQQINLRQQQPWITALLRLNQRNDDITAARRRQSTTTTTTSLYSTDDDVNNNDDDNDDNTGRLEELKKREADLLDMLSQVRTEKLEALRSKPLTIGVVGFGRFGQFISKTFAKYSNRVVVTSRSDYTDVASEIGCKYIPLDNPTAFIEEDLDVIVFAVSIITFRATIRTFIPQLTQHLYKKKQAGQKDVKGPLIVDVLSVKEHARKTLLNLLPPECDILCTHPMFGPDSGKNGWNGLTFVYEKTRINKIILDHSKSPTKLDNITSANATFTDNKGTVHNVHEDSEAFVEGMDRMSRFLSIWEEEGCNMVPMSCKDHDLYAANSQFITHLVGRTLGNNHQRLEPTPIDTKGFKSVLQLIDNTVADSFELFYGLYKYNENSQDTINFVISSLQDVVKQLQEEESREQQWQRDELKQARKGRGLGYKKIVGEVEGKTAVEEETA